MTFETGFVRAAARWTRVLHSCWLSWSRARMAELGRRKKRRRRWWKEERNRLLLVEILERKRRKTRGGEERRNQREKKAPLQNLQRVNEVLVGFQCFLWGVKMNKEDLLFLYCKQLLLFYSNLHTTIGCAQVFCNI